MLFGGAFFDPTTRSARRTSIGAFLSNAGILIGGLAIIAGVFLPWVQGVFVGSAYAPPNGIAAGGALGWLLAALAVALILGALANILGHSRPFNFGLQLFAIVAGVAALISYTFSRPCFGLPPEGIEHRIVFGPTCPWIGDGLGGGYYLVRTGAAITLISALLALAICGLATVIRHRRAPAVA
jgi:hypothetical protein